MQLNIAFIVVCGLCHWLPCVQLGNPTDPIDLQLQEKLLKILERIRLERNYDTIVIYGQSGGEDCLFHELLPKLQLPTVLLTKGSSLSDWSFSSDSLLLCCDSKAEQEQNTRSLLRLQQARRLVYLESEMQPQWLCEDYFEREQHNVAMMNAQGDLFSCRLFQEINHVQLDINSDSKYNSDSIYVQQFRNMKGAVIRSEPDQLAPRSMLYHDPVTGNIKMGGYVANVVNTFVERVNATLPLRDDLKFGENYGLFDLINRTYHNQLDIATSLLGTFGDENLDYVSYPYYSTSYCFMLPVPAKLPYNQIYTIIVDPPVLGIIMVLFVILSLLLIYSQELSWHQLSLANVILNDRCLRGLLGQSFILSDNPSRHMKAICLILFFAGLMITTMYQAYLQTLYTSPPLEEMLHSFEDFQNSRYKIALWRYEMEKVESISNVSLSTARNIAIFDLYTDFIKIRDTFNASFIYTVSKQRWRTYAEQQKSFKEQAFYYSDDVCFSRFVLFGFPLRRHLPYRQQFEQHILHMHAFGLTQFWISRSFYDMVHFNTTTLKDYSNTRMHGAVFLRDLVYIFEFYAAFHLLACFCFAIECFWARFRRTVAIKNV
ncbi:GH23483 [Drosophila grimshawi]|uniref:GH23483 n=1 Tax=Drosophila grimshawi TaxID=7222 RepID=B4K3J0_DROGR|nr:GH23483 [Drosophila grimshawi]